MPDLLPSDITAAQLIAFNVALFAALASPGPALLLSLRNTLAHGRRFGVLTGLGLASMAAIWTGAALLGLAALFEIVPWLYGAMKLCGALYLLWLALGMWRHARDPLQSTQPARSRNAFLSGLLVNLANPKSVLFAGAVIVVIFPAGLSLFDAVTVVVNHFLVEVLAYSAFAVALSTTTARAGYLRAKHVLDRVAAGIMAALGLRLLWDRAA